MEAEGRKLISNFLHSLKVLDCLQNLKHTRFPKYLKRPLRIIPVPWMISNARKIVVLGRDLTEEGLMLDINFYLVEPGLASAV